MYGDKWFDTDASIKRARQDEALCAISKTVRADDTMANESDELPKRIAATLKGYKIVSITRVKDGKMELLYETLRKSMADSTERTWLFHGTTHAAAAKIIKSGFNRSYCGRNATVFGKGVYFARDISYSTQAQYSPPDYKGEKVILAARVATGRTILGNASMIEPPDEFDTSVDSTLEPTIFVVYKDFQAIPEYEIRLAVA